MNVKGLVMAYIVWVIALLMTIPSDRGNKADINVKEVLESSLVDDLLEEAINKIQKENAEIELAKRKDEKEKRKLPELPSRGSVKRVKNSNTSMKTYMHYGKITNKSSDQYKLQQRDDIFTDTEGFRKIGDNYVIALGTYFTSEIGTLVKIHLSEGGEFTAVVGDIKANRHTDSNNLQHKKDGSVVEFLIDINELDSTIRKMGDCSYSSENNFKGDIVSVEILGNIRQ